MRVKFQGSHGEELIGKLELPTIAKPRAFAIFAHSFIGTKDIFAARSISRNLAGLGIATLRFDFTGLGQSGGAFEHTTFSSDVADIIRAACYLDKHYEAPSLLIGHSLGGAAALAAAGEIDSIKAIVTIGAPSDPAHVAHHFQNKKDTICKEGRAEVSLGGKNFTITSQFIQDLHEQELLKKVSALHQKALLILHSPTDNIVGIEHAKNLYNAAKHPKSFISLDNIDHLVTSRDGALYVADVISAWSARYVPRKPSEKGEGGKVIVAESNAGQFAQRISTRDHQFIADEPESLGGENLGPNPYELLLASIGACTSMTIRMYAKHKGLSLEHIEVHLSHEKTYVEDCKECLTEKEKANKKVEIITREISLKGNLSEEERQKCLEIANKCPVHKTIDSHPTIITKLI